MVGKQVLGWVQGRVACAISVGGGWGGCGARERARGVRGQAHRVVDVATSPKKRARGSGRWWRRPRRAGDSALAGARAAARRNRAGPERAPVAVASTCRSRSTFRWLKELRPYTRAATGVTARLTLTSARYLALGCGADPPLTQSPKRVLRARRCRSRCSTCHLGYSKAGKLPNCDEAPCKLTTARRYPEKSLIF